MQGVTAEANSNQCVLMTWMRVFQPVGLAIYPSRLAVLRGITHKCPSSPFSALKLQSLHNMCSCHCLQGQVIWCASGRMQFLSTETSNSTTCKLMQIHETLEVTYILCTSPCYYWRAAGSCQWCQLVMPVPGAVHATGGAGGLPVHTLVCVGGCWSFVVASHTKGSCTVSYLSDRRG